MASAARSLRLACRSCRSQRPIQHVGPKIFVAWKSVSGGNIKEVKETSTDGQKPSPFDNWAAEDLEHDRKYRNMTPSDVAKDLFSEEERGLFGELAAELAGLGDTEIRKEQDAARELSRPLRVAVKPRRDAFWDEDEDDKDLISNDDSDEFDENDMTDIAHAKLEEHREQRAYARLAIWEMPMLSQYAKPFELPTKEQPLRFRYTSYMGEYHPAEKKVVVEFSPEDFGLTEIQKMKLRKLAGPRYNPEKEVIKMSCESFEHQAQNKRYLAELVEKLVTEAKDPADTFEDIPLDLRHHTFKVKPKFPKEWRLSEERVKELQTHYQQARLADKTKQEEGTLVDGIQAIQKAIATRKPREEVPELVGVPRKAQPRRRVRL
ncbi:mitochondrial ribosomal small subunit component [Diaporthe amygdali]|uniref:mitochondrial ribosomal small subunit component n=1 Tax=Phomopsis amygdali TaxID=1214568 RepID=UPI0022FF2896|nr:mitochondrial ribosomal small subunit component [Diaporthe amygdali]KAJ0120280.1 mitochondrial ribosomal small subunit component [Diaporthe amygdali]